MSIHKQNWFCILVDHKAEQVGLLLNLNSDEAAQPTPHPTQSLPPSSTHRVWPFVHSIFTFSSSWDLYDRTCFPVATTIHYCLLVKSPPLAPPTKPVIVFFLFSSSLSTSLSLSHPHRFYQKCRFIISFIGTT